MTSTFLEEISDVVEELGFKGKAVGEPPYPEFQGELSAEQYLLLQIMMGDKVHAKSSLKKGAEPNYQSPKGYSLHQLAEAYRYNDIADMLVESGAKPSVKTHPTKR